MNVTITVIVTVENEQNKEFALDAVTEALNDAGITAWVELQE